MTFEPFVTKDGNSLTMDNSYVSTASSTTDYSGIGFERTMTLYFEDLKRDQGFVTTKVMEVTKGYRALVIREARWEARKKSLAEEAAKQGLMLSDMWLYSEEDMGEEMSMEMESGRKRIGDGGKWKEERSWNSKINGNGMGEERKGNGNFAERDWAGLEM